LRINSPKPAAHGRARLTCAALSGLIDGAAAK